MVWLTMYNNIFEIPVCKKDCHSNTQHSCLQVYSYITVNRDYTMSCIFAYAKIKNPGNNACAVVQGCSSEINFI